MIYKLYHLIASAGNSTPRTIEKDGKWYTSWVRAMHLQFHGGVLDRLRDALSVYRRKAVAVTWPESGDLEDIFNTHGELLPEQMKEADIIKLSHKIGLHNGKNNYVTTDCQECYNESMKKYIKQCTDLLQEFDAKELPAFLDYMERINDESSPLSERWWNMHEHPIYMVCGFFGYDHRSYKAIQLEVIYDRQRIEKENAKPKDIFIS